MNLAHLQQLRSKLERYQSNIPIDNQSFDYNHRPEDLVDTAETLEIELQGFIDKMRRTTETEQRALSSETATKKDTIITKQLEITVPKFEGDRAKYKAFKSAITILTQRKQWTPKEKMLFLSQHLGPKPAGMLENIQLTEAGYELAGVADTIHEAVAL